MSAETKAQSLLLRRFDAETFAWDGVERMPYKEEGAAPFKSIARQVLFDRPDLACQLRYFETAPGGYSTLERHGHVHGVIIVRGSGHCLVGNAIRPVQPFDLVTIPPWTWHQFRATGSEPLGFLCMVNSERDRPQLPSSDELAALSEDPAIAAFLAGSTPA